MKPYITLLPGFLLRKPAFMFRGVGSSIATHEFKDSLKKANITVSGEDYVAMSIFSSLFYFVFVSVVLFMTASKFELEPLLPISLGVGAVVGFLVLIQNLKLPKAILNSKVKIIEKNLIPAVRDMVVQLNSGIPLFDIIVNISNGKYGAITVIFKKAAKDIIAGKGQAAVIEEIAAATPSRLFRRVMWQIVNAMKIGAPITEVLKNALDDLYEEQTIQIQKYGGTLGGLAMFYMLVAVIAPTIFFTLSIIVSMFLEMSPGAFTLFFFVMLLGVMFLQVFFLGIIRVKRPALL